MSPVITAAGHTALVSAKAPSGPPPPHTGPAAADAFGGHENSNRLPFWPRSAAAVAVHVVPAGPDEVAVGVAEPLPGPTVAISFTLPLSTPCAVCSRTVTLPAWRSCA